MMHNRIVVNSITTNSRQFAGTRREIVISSAYHNTSTSAIGQDAPGKRPAQRSVSVQRDGVTRPPGRRDTVRRITTVLLIPLAFCFLIMAASAVDVNNTSVSATTTGTVVTTGMSSTGTSGSYTGSSQAVASATIATSATSSGTGLSVTKTALDPEVLMPGDTGTLTVEVSNTGNTAGTYNHANLAGSSVANRDTTQYLSGGTVNPGSKMVFTFPVQAGSTEGVQYPEFSLALDAGTLRYPVPVKVDGTGLVASIATQPDAYVQGLKDPVSLSIGNPRQNSVSGVQIISSGAGSTVTPTSVFIGALASNGQVSKDFSVTPDTEGNVTFQVRYTNGLNPHTATLTVPITFSVNKAQADLLLSNIATSQVSGVTHVTGDITNAGLTGARSIVITSGGGVTPTDPDKSAVVGSLAADDFSSFEVTFTDRTNARSVPMEITYKDAEGNLFNQSVNVDIAVSNATGQNGGGAPSGAPSGASGTRGGTFGVFGNITRAAGGLVLPIIVILVVVGGAALYLRRRRR